MLDFIDGHKTYVALVCFILYHVAKGKGLIVLDAGTDEAINATLLGAAGLALRAAVKKAEMPQ